MGTREGGGEFVTVEDGSVGYICEALEESNSLGNVSYESGGLQWWRDLPLQIVLQFRQLLQVVWILTGERLHL